jgi:hypothetical protein
MSPVPRPSQSVEKTLTDVSRKRHVLACPRHREIWSQSEKVLIASAAATASPSGAVAAMSA